MAQSKPVRVVTTSSSTCADMFKCLKDNGYFNRTIWERRTVIDVLQQDEFYHYLNTCDKEQYGTTMTGHSSYNHIVKTTLFKKINSDHLLFATVAHRQDPASVTSANQAYMDSTKDDQNCVFSSVLHNAEVTKETGKEGVKIATMQSIQLFRYDAVGKHVHQNKIHLGDYYDYYGDAEIKKAYRYFFEDKVGYPHFHFLSRTMSELYGKTAESNAISLDKLIEYVDMLKGRNFLSPILNKFDFGMPFLKIKQDKIEYKTCIDYEFLCSALDCNFANLEIAKDFMKDYADFSGEVVLTGLNAVFADLVVLKMLRDLCGGKSKSAQEVVSEIKAKNAEEQKAYFGEKATSFKFISAFGDDYPFSDVETIEADDCFYQTPPFVLEAELQLASKIASLGKMPLNGFNDALNRNLNGPEMSLDDETIAMLKKVKGMAQRQLKKENSNEPRNK